MGYEFIIGLEVHAELSTKTKIYCGCTAEFGGEQNAHCCPVCLGLPGSLPVLNKNAVDLCIKAGLALNCKINRAAYMARKNYFYPDCPKNYQITQDEAPVCRDGYIEIESGEGFKKIGIQRIHIEEDAGKALHREDGTYLDYNRSGIPLVEIVSDPDMRSPEEAVMYLEKIKEILQYLDVSDCRMEEGSLRCDANISVRQEGSMEFGVKTEIKNMNSFKAVEKALRFEAYRQMNAIERGESIRQETRRWDEAKEETLCMRSKEEAHDYRYFPEPDMPCLFIDDEWISGIRESIPELPEARRKKYTEWGLPEYDAQVLTSSRALSDFFEECIKAGGSLKDTSNWIMGELLRTLRESRTELKDIKFRPRALVELTQLVDKGSVSVSMAKNIFKEMFVTGQSPDKIAEEKGLLQVSDEDEIRTIVKRVIGENPQSVEDFKNGKTKAVGFLMGRVMRASGGKANPQVVSSILEEEMKK